MLRQQTIPGFYEALVEASIETLRFWEPKDKPYWGCFSGGKDSCVIKELAKMAGVAVEWHYSVTTIDPPELVAFIKRHHSDVARDKPKRSFFHAIRTRGIPTRVARWCCEEFKETRSGEGRRLIMGIRAAESPRRAANWQTFTRLHNTSRGTHRSGESVAPIVRWRDADVWRFIRERNLPYCSLYDEGRKRLGCIGCPMSGSAGKTRDFARWPAIARQWKRAAQARWEQQKAAGVDSRSYNEFDTFEDFWQWWLSDDPLPGKSDECQGQLEFWS